MFRRVSLFAVAIAAVSAGQRPQTFTWRDYRQRVPSAVTARKVTVVGTLDARTKSIQVESITAAE